MFHNAPVLAQDTRRGSILTSGMNRVGKSCRYEKAHSRTSSNPECSSEREETFSTERFLLTERIS